MGPAAGSSRPARTGGGSHGVWAARRGSPGLLQQAGGGSR